MERFLNTIFKYGVAALLIFVPLYPKFPLFTVPFSYVSIRAEDFLIALLWGIYFLKILVSKSWRKPPLFFQILVFAIVGAVTSVSAILVTKNVQPILVVLHYARRLEYISAFFFIYEIAKNPAQRKFLLELIIYPSAVVFLYGLAQIYLKAPVISTMDSEAAKGSAGILQPGTPLSSTFGGHYDLAIYLSFIMSFLAALMAYINSKKNIPIYFLFCALLWLFMQAGLRTGLAGLFLSVAFICYFFKRYLLGFILCITIVASLFTSPSLLGRFKDIFGVVINKITYVVTPVFAAEEISTVSATPSPEPERAIQADRSTSIRFDVEWPRAMRSFYKNPFFGTGYSSLGLATDSDYLRSLGETGLIGLITFISIIVGLGRGLFTRIKKSQGIGKVIVMGAAGSFIVFIVTGVFLDAFESSKIATLFWGFMGLAMSIKNENS